MSDEHTLVSGRYETTEPEKSTWRSFTYDAKTGVVHFVDTDHGHIAVWGTKHSEGPSWVASMERRLADGTLICTWRQPGG